MKLLKLAARIILFSFILIGVGHYSFSVTPAICGTDQNPNAVTQQNNTEKDIQWFKREMKIDPKYIERQEGILGMSWIHFLSMSFLVIFFFGALIAYHRRTTRTARILENLLKED